MNCQQQGETTNNPRCPTGPDSVTEALPANISSDFPRTCFDTAHGERCFYSYVPECAQGKKVPLVLDIHGLESCPSEQVNYSGWVQKAMEECFILAMPLGITDPNVADTTCFNYPGGISFGSGINELISADCCCTKYGFSIDPAETNDPAFLRSVVETLVDSFSSASDTAIIDITRIYISGHSNGCISSLAMAATSSDLVAAVCCMAGALIQPFAADYSPVPIWTVHGLKDSVILPERDVFNWDGSGFPSLTDRTDYIAEKNGCSGETTETPLLDDQGAVIGKVVTRSDCGENGAPVELVILNEAGHTPYMGYVNDDPGSSVTTIDTTSMAWNFCKSFSKAAASVPASSAPNPAPVMPEPTDSPLPTSSAGIPSTPTIATVTLGLVLSVAAVSMQLYDFD